MKFATRLDSCANGSATCATSASGLSTAARRRCGVSPPWRELRFSSLPCSLEVLAYHTRELDLARAELTVANNSSRRASRSAAATSMPRNERQEATHRYPITHLPTNLRAPLINITDLPRNREAIATVRKFIDATWDSTAYPQKRSVAASRKTSGGLAFHQRFAGPHGQSDLANPEIVAPRRVL